MKSTILNKKTDAAYREFEKYRLSKRCLKTHDVPRGFKHQKPFPQPLVPLENYVRPSDDVLADRFADHGFVGGTEFYAGDKSYDEVCEPQDEVSSIPYKMDSRLKDMNFDEEWHALWLREVRASKSADTEQSWVDKMRRKYPNKLLFYSVLDDLYCAKCDGERYLTSEEPHQFLCASCFADFEPPEFGFDDVQLSLIE